ncbi:MFS transporter [Blastococcus goldschmidtiae]|uniref:MFS transporter n=1 Tax=Blastococcus goldschmidtiae TaxID=3075546 RepID=A0ABU2K829_9ACTN|nr:MFS transporter [Blastococcus sp. DSM 46792]MDT0276347.1 MFS transporter [Blastococcus sp. DSM 46792]
MSEAGIRTPLWRGRGMQGLMGVTLLGFTSYCLTLASLPAYAVVGGAAESSAGVVTAVFLLATILTQTAIPALTARCGTGPVLVAGLLAMGLPAPLYVLDDSVFWISALSAVRGAGFAVLTVLGATLAIRVAPRERRGEAVGVYGLAIAIPNLVAIPAGAALVLNGHVGWLAWLSAAPVLGVVFVPMLVGSVGPEPRPGPAGSGRAAVRAALAPSAVLFVVTLAGGGLVTFLPIERPDGAVATVALLVFGLGAAVTRWGAGLLADRLRSRMLLPLSLLGAAAGMVVTALGLGGDRTWIVVGAALCGAGFGAVQNLTLLAAFRRAGENGTTTASAVWNASFDGGTGTGALLIGLVAAGIGLDWTYVAVGVLLTLLWPLASVAAREPGAARR